MKKAISLIFLLLICQSTLLKSQTKNEFPEGLKKLSMKELMDMGNLSTEGLPIYSIDGQLLDTNKAQEMMSSMEWVSDYYANKEGKLVALRLRKISDQEKAFMEQFREEQKKLEALIGTDAKVFETVDINGNSINLEDLKGSVVAINFWFIGCKPCIQEMPELNEIVEKFHGKDVKFIAIALDPKDKLKSFSEKRDFDYDIIPDGRTLASLYGITGYPTHCIVDQEGKIQYFKSAYSPQTASELESTITDLLKD